MSPIPGWISKHRLAQPNAKKWESLLHDYDQAVVQSKTTTVGFETQNLLDKPESENDIGLWAEIFNFCHRRNGVEGALVVWQEIFNRKALHQTGGAVAGGFWEAILNSALDDEPYLESIWAYAEWLRDRHGALWPRYYLTVVQHCLEQSQLDRAIRWHFRLSPHFDPGRMEFYKLLETYISDGDPAMQGALQWMYATSAHRQFYDTIIPLLWSQGNSSLAKSWRRVLSLQGDTPTSSGVRPFLKYLLGYWPKTPLLHQELLIAQSRPGQPLALDTSAVRVERSAGLRSMLARIRSETFGIEEKTYNDELGARWFATTWVSLGAAANLVRMLGIEEIGPLSLQSIALREQDSLAVFQRVEQLESLGISIGRSKYARAIRHLAKANDSETLRELLHSDLHPDVFEDPVNYQRRLFETASSTGDWSAYRLVMAVRVAVSSDSIGATLNDLVLACVERRRKRLLLRVLDELHVGGVDVSGQVSHAVSQRILDDVVSASDRDVDFYVALSRQIATMGLPIATQAWQKLLLLLSDQGRLDEVERLALEVAHRYASWSQSETPGIKVHPFDVPEMAREVIPDDADARFPYHLVPRDLEPSHDWHPLQLVFDAHFVDRMIRNSFRWMSSRGQATAGLPVTPRSQPAQFGLGRGLRLARMLQEKGVRIDILGVRTAANNCLSELFGPDRLTTRHAKSARSRNRLTVREIKMIMDQAWGSRDWRNSTSERDGEDTGVAKALEEEKTSSI